MTRPINLKSTDNYIEQKPLKLYIYPNKLSVRKVYRLYSHMDMMSKLRSHDE